MSEKKAKPYTAEFKESAAKLTVKSGKPATETNRELGVNINNLHTWIAKYHRSRPDNKVEKNGEHILRRNQTVEQRKCQAERKASHIKGVSLKECH